MKPTDKRVIEIAEYIWGDYSKKSNEITSHFAKKFRISERRVEALLADARSYNKERQNKASKIKDRVFIQKEIESVESAYNRRKKLLDNLYRIAIGEPKEVGVEVDQEGNVKTKLVPVRDADQIAATKEIFETEGWKAAVKTESVISVNGIDKNIDEMTDEELEYFLRSDPNHGLRTT